LYIINYSFIKLFYLAQLAALAGQGACVCEHCVSHTDGGLFEEILTWLAWSVHQDFKGH